MVFGFIKRLFKKEEENLDLNLEQNTAEIINIPQENPSVQMNIQEPIQQKYEQPILNPQTFLPQIQQTNELIDLKQQLQILSNKLDMLNSKLDLVLQRLQILEQYFYYRR